MCVCVAPGQAPSANAASTLGAESNTALLGPGKSFCKHKRSDPYRMSTVIKLEYDLSNSVYTRIKNLILWYILHWFLPREQQQLLKRDVVNGSAPLPPSLLAPQDMDTPSGVSMMRAMWYTTRDNVSLILEICRQGFTTLTDPAHKRALVSLYSHWTQVCPCLSVWISVTPTPLFCRL